MFDRFCGAAGFYKKTTETGERGAKLGRGGRRTLAQSRGFPPGDPHGFVEASLIRPSEGEDGFDAAQVSEFRLAERQPLADQLLRVSRIASSPPEKREIAERRSENRAFQRMLFIRSAEARKVLSVERL